MTGERGRRTSVGEQPLTWLYRRGLLSDRQFCAGAQLERDYEQAGLGARVTMRWEPTPASRGRRGPARAIDPTAAQIGARQRFEGALDRAGSGLQDILWRVVCAGEGLEAAERGLGWPKRAGKLVLGMGLDRVADYYRIG